MILGGCEQDGKESKVVEEIDFIKRNLVPLPPLKQGRVTPSAFLVNDSIYVFGGTVDVPNASQTSEVVIGEKLALREIKWRDVVSRTAESSAAAKVMQILESKVIFGPASLLYE